MTEKLFTGTLNHNQNKTKSFFTNLQQSYCPSLSFGARYLENEWTEFNQIMLQCGLTGLEIQMTELAALL